MKKRYILTEEEAKIISEKTGIDMKEKESDSPFSEYLTGEIDMAIASADDGSYDESVIKSLQQDIDSLVKKFEEKYINEGDGSVTEAMDVIYDIVLEFIIKEANKREAA